MGATYSYTQHKRKFIIVLSTFQSYINNINATHKKELNYFRVTVPHTGWPIHKVQQWCPLNTKKSH